MKMSFVVIAALLVSGSAQAAETVFSDRTGFTAALTDSFTDSYETSLGYPVGFRILGNAAMSAVVGETNYLSTGWAEWNFILPGADQAYCAGCNGSFTLSFGTTSFTSENGVFGVGLDIEAGSGTYDALVSFGDGGMQLFALPAPNNFWGLTSDRQIASIAFGPGGQVTQGGSIVIDNLTIGSGGTVPEPATWAMLIAGFGLVGTASRRQRRVPA